MKILEKRKCNNCDFWYDSGGYKGEDFRIKAECRKRAPIIIEDNNKRIFPETSCNCWCGDWENKNSKGKNK